MQTMRISTLTGGYTYDAPSVSIVILCSSIGTCMTSLVALRVAWCLPRASRVFALRAWVVSAGRTDVRYWVAGVWCCVALESQ